MTSTDPTQHACSSSLAAGASHHLVSQAGTMTCSYCGQTASQIRARLLAGVTA